MHLVEIGVMEQRYQAVMAVVQDGWLAFETQCDWETSVGVSDLVA